MSYEGYTQLLCGGCHYSAIDCYDDPSNACYCGKEWVWWNSVDETNGSYDIDANGNEVRIDGYVELQIKTGAAMHTCSCGHTHETSAATYVIPPPNVGHHEKHPSLSGDFPER